MSINADTKSTLVAAVTEIATEALAAKPFWQSKTFWTNTVAALAILAQMRWGFIIDADTQALALTLANLVLRKITTTAIA